MTTSLRVHHAGGDRPVRLWLLERRHGPAAVLTLFLIGGVGGLAATTAVYPDSLELGAVGAALAMVCAWAIPDLLALRARAATSRAT